MSENSFPKVLVQLDSDPHASVFDAVVAIDSGVDHLLQYQAVEPTQVRDLVHGAMFTRGPNDLKNTAVFIGGSTVAAGELLMRQVVESFFGPIRVSVMMDANGANTTAAAAVLAARRHVDLSGITATVLAATGPVGQRVVRLLAAEGAEIRVASRRLERAEQVCREISDSIESVNLSAWQTSNESETTAALSGAQAVIAAGAAGIELISQEARRQSGPEVAIDLNAVPPLGIAGVEVTDSAVDRQGTICYGAIGVGGTKMKIHRAAIRSLFESNSCLLDAEEIYALGKSLE